MTIKPPAMTPQQVADYPLFAPGVRITCYRHGCTLFVGDEVPEGGADAVAQAAGCPSWSDPDTDPNVYDDCPVPAELVRLAAEAAPPHDTVFGAEEASL